MIASSWQDATRGRFETSEVRLPPLVRGDGAVDACQVPPRLPPNGRAGRHFARLAAIIEAEVIPRLVLARRATGSVDPPTDRGPDRQNVIELTDIVLARDASVASRYVEAMRERGVAVEALYLDLLAPTARELGEMWTADICSFSDVTIALGRLQQMLHNLSPCFQFDGEQANGLRVLLVPAPGDQHTFGLTMVAEFFRRAGWDVWTRASMTRHELIEAVGEQWFALVGLSVSCGVRMEALASAVRAVRRFSRNRSIGILVGGPAFTEEPTLASLIGADATAADGRRATTQAHHLLSSLLRRRA